jgi:cell wall-associated NlpC family hydrolase
MRKEPDGEAEQVNELRFGDSFTVYEEKDGWAYGQSGRDNYVGYITARATSKKLMASTHRVSVPVTFLFSEASIKSPPLDRLTLLSTVEVVKEADKFCELKTGGFIHREHLAPLASPMARDPVAIAERLLDVPYLWGGVSPLGCDCSGLIQMALEACGARCPRDSDMQASDLGQAASQNNLRRGDIICFKGHIGFMVDAQNLLHANAYHGRVTCEPLADVVARGSAITGVRRLG